MKKSWAIVSTVLAAAVSLAAPRKAADITVAGYTGSSTLENFPVLVRISPARISGFSRPREPGRYSFTAASPCRNAGSNDAFGAPASAVDLLGAPRLYGKIIDIGCFELQSGAGTVLILQ